MYIIVFLSPCRSMSGTHLLRMGHNRSSSRGSSKDFSIATPEEYVKGFGGDFVIKRVG
jgi:acetyl-CoA carboxylase/biotin carboxylase 1